MFPCEWIFLITISKLTPSISCFDIISQAKQYRISIVLAMATPLGVGKRMDWLTFLAVDILKSNMAATQKKVGQYFPDGARWIEVQIYT